MISEPTPSDALVMDTHVWLWASGQAGGPRKLKASLVRCIEDAAQARRLFVSAASVWELALKESRGRALVAGDLTRWVHAQTRFPGVRVVPIDSGESLECERLPNWVRERDGNVHRDPADRFIVTTARLRNAVLVTCDAEILSFAADGHLRACDARR